LIFIANHRAEPVKPADSAPVVSLDDAKRIFPAAARLGEHDARNAQAVLSADGTPLGWVLTTSPETDDLIGYSGPSNLLVGIDSEGRVVRVELAWSKDTAVHVNAIDRDIFFWKQFVGWHAADSAPLHVDAVSGSTLTSLALAEAVQRRLGGEAMSLRFQSPITMQEVRKIFPAAAHLQDHDSRPGWQRVLNAEEQTLGFVIRTSPQADNVIGYQGPTEMLLAISGDEQTVTAVRLRASYDTPDYVDRIRSENDFLKQLAGRTIREWVDLDFHAAGIEGVSGATQTSFAIAEGIRRRMQAERRAGGVSHRSLQPRDWGLLSIILGGLVMNFSPLRGRRGVRWLWQAVLVAAFGLWFGDLLSISLLAGWPRGGVPWRTAPALIALAAVALLTPWATKRQVYCHHLCPHGAAQEWLGRFRRWHWHLPASLTRALSFVPAILLGVAFFIAVTGVPFDLSQLEPFDAWVLKGTALVSLAIAISGLVASLFMPMAYCRFGCPTGALLKFIRSHGSNERFSLRDGAALGLLVIGAACVFGPAMQLEPKSSAPAEGPVLSGDAFGTTWSVKLRIGVRDHAALQSQIAAELERIESSLSHWRPESETSQFNSSATTLEMEYSPELIGLADRAAALSRATDGAFDVTVGPLVNAWGYGPAGQRAAPPDDEIAKLLEATGWQKLHVDTQFDSLRKDNPDLKIDLGALLQGYAADRVAALLDSAGVNEYLINVGGELLARGPWTVAIDNPRDTSQLLRTLTLKDAALATSGVYRHSSAGEPQTRHIISPKTGRPIESKWRLCAAMRPTCVDADGWATALLASDAAKSLDIARREHIAALFVDDAGNVTTTDEFPLK